jgi:8-amino-7-oxononanoate synthase
MSSPESLEQRIRLQLRALEATGQLRTLRPPSGVDLSSNDYLGLASHPVIKARMAEGVMRHGCGSTGSRLLRGERQCFADIEDRFAEFNGVEAALYFSSGYAANLGVLSVFLEPGDVVFSDEFNHASLIDGMRLSRARRIVYPHCDVEVLRRLISAASGSGQKFLVTESLFSMDGDQAPLAEYAELCGATDTALILDEAHAVGIYGKRGSGLAESAGISGNVFLSINPAGKALGVCGAFVAGSRWAIEYLRQRARTFIFSTAPPPALAAALEGSLTIVATEPERRTRLLELADYLRGALIKNGVALTPGNSQIIPVIVGDNTRAAELSEMMWNKGFDVRAIRPPTVPPGTARLRICVNTGLDEITLERFAAALGSAFS